MIKTTTLLKFKAFRNVINLSNKEKKIDQHAGSHSKKHMAAEQIRKALCSRLVLISKSPATKCSLTRKTKNTNSLQSNAILNINLNTRSEIL